MSTSYGNGNIAIKINEQNGTGFIYYPSGSVAVCSSEASSYQNRYYAFDCNKSNTLLLAIDEYGVGFVSVTKIKSFQESSLDLTFSKVGGLITKDGKITHEWKWNREAQNAGTLPDREVVVRLNEYLTFRFKSLREMQLSFKCENISRDFDLGVKKRREDSYLDHAKRSTGGKLIPQIKNVTLKDRQVEFNKKMRAIRNKVHPRSDNLSDLVKDIVHTLEDKFDTIPDRLKLDITAHSPWKETALQSTLSELPKIPITGTEVGLKPGFSDSIYCESNNFTKTAPARLMKRNGDWKGSVEILHLLNEENPPLPRSNTLKANSGRYSTMLVVDKANATADNPTGMTTIQGLKLRKVTWQHFQEISNQNSNQLYVVLVIRSGDAICASYERITEFVNLEYSKDTTTTPTRLKPILLKIEISEDGEVMSRLKIKSIPIFLCFHGPNLVYAGPIGGKKVKVSCQTTKKQVLLIEPNFHDQIRAERTLRKIDCDTYLCLTGSEAIRRLQQMNINATSAKLEYDLVLVSDQLEMESIATLAKLLNESLTSKRTIAAVLVSVLGEHGRENLEKVPWENFTSKDMNALNLSHFNSLAKIAIQKPIKASAINVLKSLQSNSIADSNFGLTPESLRSKIDAIQQSIVSGHARTLEYVGIRMSAMDTRLSGGKALATST